MRIVVISDLPQFVTGGAETQAASLIEAWMDAGHEVICFGRRMGSGPVRLGRHPVSVRRIHVVSGLGRTLRGMSYLLSLSLLLLRHRRRIDVIYTRFLGDAALTAGLLKQAGLLDVRLVSVPASTGGERSDMQFLASLPFRRWMIRMLDRQCDAINLIAPAMSAELRSAGFSGHNFFHIPNGVVVREPPAAMPSRQGHFVAVGRISREKGYDILIEALALVKDKLRPGVVRIAGDGPDRATLQAHATEIGVDHAIEWLGMLDHEQVLQALEQAQVFLLPSRYEGMSNAGLEAMERGLAIVMTRCGGLDTYVQPNMGWVVEPEDPEALAAALSQAIRATTARLSAMGESCRACVLQNFDQAAVATRYLELFESVLSAGREGR